MTGLEYYMHNFDINELINFLGRELSKLLVEWLPEGEALYTEDNLINMILSVHGTKILNSKSFRERLLKTFEVEKIQSFRDYLPGFENEENLKLIIDSVLRSPWDDNEISLHFLDIIGVTKDIFVKEVDQRNSIENVKTEKRFYELLDYQFTIKQKILTYVNSGNQEAKMIVRMPTGTGKTKTAMHTIINQFTFQDKKQGLVIWIAHTKELLEQAYETFCNVWKHIGDGEVTTYKMWDKFTVDKEVVNNGFMFCGIQKLMSIYKNDKALFDILVEKSSMIVIDEAHRASASKTKTVIQNLMNIHSKNKALIGLTATPGRGEDEASRLFRYMFDNKIIDIDTTVLNALSMSKTDADNTEVEIDIIQYFQRRGILARLRREKLEYGDLTEKEISNIKVHLKSNGYRDFTDSFLNTLAINKNRNTTIVNRLIELNNEHIPTIVFACSVEHGKLLSAALTMQGVKNGHVFGDMDSLDRKNIIARFKNRDDDLNILVNYEVLTTGFDSTNIRCVFITRPTNSVVLYSQMLGRGLRGPLMGGNKECLLIDIEDNLNRYTNESEAFNFFNEYWI